MILYVLAFTEFSRKQLLSDDMSCNNNYELTSNSPTSFTHYMNTYENYVILIYGTILY